MYQLQSIIINKNKYNLEDAINWVKENNWVIKKVDETEHYYRFRQVNPLELKLKGYNQIITKEISDGIKFIIYYNPH